MEKIGILTGGGDCPGLNAVIRAVVRRAQSLGYDVLGVKNGWAGLVQGQVEPLTDFSVIGILPRGGTILGTSRTNPYKKTESLQQLKSNWRKFGLNYLVAVGGEDTLGVAHRLYKEGYAVVGVPKTIDNDLAGTDYTFGFDTAVQIVAEAIDRLHTTAESHHRVMVVEVMGRHTGWIATYSGMAGGADSILVPERPFNIHDVCGLIQKRLQRGRRFAIVVVAEGAKPDGTHGAPITRGTRVDEFGHERLGGIGEWLGKQIEDLTGIETRVTVLGHVQRGGTPTAYDRVLATRLGLMAIELIRNNQFGTMSALRGTEIIGVPIEEALRAKPLDPKVFDDAAVFFG
jgi:phosphofructokinase-like protein